MNRIAMAAGYIPSFLNPLPLMPDRVKTTALHSLKLIEDSFLQLHGTFLVRSAKFLLPRHHLAASIRIPHHILKTLFWGITLSTALSFISGTNFNAFFFGCLIGGAINLSAEFYRYMLEFPHYPKKFQDLLAVNYTHQAHRNIILDLEKPFPIHLLFDQNEMDQFLELKETQEFFGENGCRLLKLLPALPLENRFALLLLYDSNPSIFIALTIAFTEYRITEGAAEKDRLKQFLIAICSPNAFCEEPLKAIFDSGIADWLEAAIKDPASDEAWAPFDAEMVNIETALSCLKDLVSEELDFKERFATCKKKIREKGVFNLLTMKKSDLEKMFSRDEKQELRAKEKLVPFLLSHTPFETRKFLGYPKGITEKQLAGLQQKIQWLTDEQQIELCKKLEGLEIDQIIREIDTVYY